METDFGSLPDLTRALMRAVRGAGCRVTDVQWRVGGVACDCPDVQSKVDLLNAIGTLSAQDPYIASFGLTLRGSWPDNREFAPGLVSWVQRHIRWVDEPGERFQLPRLTLGSRMGDCDCSAPLIMAACLTTGLRARVVGLVDDDGAGIHAAAQIDGRAMGSPQPWIWAEGSTKATPLGTDPRTLLGRSDVQPAGWRLWPFQRPALGS